MDLKIREEGENRHRGMPDNSEHIVMNSFSVKMIRKYPAHSSCFEHSYQFHVKCQSL